MLNQIELHSKAYHCLLQERHYISLWVSYPADLSVQLEIYDIYIQKNICDTLIFLAVEMTTFETRFTSHLTTPILNSQARSSPSSQLKKRVCCRSLPRIYWKMKRGAISGPLYELSVFLSWGTAQAHIRGQKWISIPLGMSCISFDLLFHLYMKFHQVTGGPNLSVSWWSQGCFQVNGYEEHGRHGHVFQVMFQLKRSLASIEDKHFSHEFYGCMQWR